MIECAAYRMRTGTLNLLSARVRAENGGNLLAATASAHPAEDHLMSCDGEARQLLHPPGRILQNARGHFLDSAAAVAADVLVVVLKPF